MAWGSTSLRQSLLDRVESRQAGSSLGDALDYFLRFGHLPWNSVVTRVAHLEEQLRSLSGEEADRILTRIRFLWTKPNPRRRLIYQFSDEFFAWIAQRIFGEFANLVLPGSGAILASPASTAAREVVLSVAASLSNTERLSAEILTAMLRDHSRHLVQRDGRSDIQPGHNSVMTRPVESDLSTVESLSAEPSSGQYEGTDVPEALTTDPDARVNPLDTLAEAAQTLPESTEIYVQYAGIVLLHAFLERFFDRLDLFDASNNFKSDSAQVRAVHLLHYLATGVERPEENETVLFKILCGVPLETPLVRDVHLTQKEKDEAQELLNAVITHWSRLGNTSPEGLRDGFFRREGKLLMREGGWLLMVETNTIDVLLGYLPWNLSLVRFPWTNTVIWIDWA